MYKLGERERERDMYNRRIMSCYKRRVSRVSTFQQSDLRVVHAGARCSSINSRAYSVELQLCEIYSTSVRVYTWEGRSKIRELQHRYSNGFTRTSAIVIKSPRLRRICPTVWRTRLLFLEFHSLRMTMLSTIRDIKVYVCSMFHCNSSHFD